MAVEIRKLNSSDMAEFKRLRLESLQTNPESFGSHYAREAVFADDEFSKRLISNENRFIYGAFDDVRLVAMVGFYVVEQIGNIWGVFTTPEHRGCGISKQLMKQIIDEVKVRPSLAKIQLGVTNESAAAQALYKKLGFKTYDIEQNAITHGDFSMCEILMELRIDLNQ